MFNKEGIPFFTITIPFLCIVFLAFFSTSYYLKVTEENFESHIVAYKKLYLSTPNASSERLRHIIEEKKESHKKSDEEFISFILVLTLGVLIFMVLFTFLMTSIISEVIKKYKLQVQNREAKLENLNKTLATKVQIGIEEGKRKDKAILDQSKLARMGSMISMIAHQWRQPLTELSGILMELETATRFKKVNEEHILNSIEKSDKMIEFMSNTIDDFRNFYKPDKKKEIFSILDSCQRAINLVDASLNESNIKLILEVDMDRRVDGYPTEYSQVILNLITNARDVLLEKKIKNPHIILNISSRGRLSVVLVRDNAGGIKEENFDLIFDPYFSTKDSSKGTGLGLYISKLIIERNMGGELSVYNDEQGAVFKIVVLG